MSKKAITKKEFEKYYMLRPEKKDIVALECNCGVSNCYGWAVVQNDELSIKAHKELYG